MNIKRDLLGLLAIGTAFTGGSMACIKVNPFLMITSGILSVIFLIISWNMEEKND